MKTLETFKISLAAARVNARMTQEDVAKIMHISKQTIANWENGKTIPKIASLEKLCDIYNIPPNFIFLPTNSTYS